MCCYCMEAQVVLAMWQQGRFIGFQAQYADEFTALLLCMEATPLQGISLYLYDQVPDSTILALRLATISLKRPLHLPESLLHQQYCTQTMPAIDNNHQQWPQLGTLLQQRLATPHYQPLSSLQLQTLLNEAVQLCQYMLQQYYTPATEPQPLTDDDILNEQDNQQHISRTKLYYRDFPLLYLATELLTEYQPTAVILLQLATAIPDPRLLSLMTAEPLWLQRRIFSHLYSRLGLNYILPSLAKVRLELSQYLLNRHNLNHSEQNILLCT